MQEEFEFEHNDDEWDPAVIAEIQRRVATPRDQWITNTLADFRAEVERETRLQHNRLNLPLPSEVLERYYAEHPEKRPPGE